jgi:ribosomal protein S17
MLKQILRSFATKSKLPAKPAAPIHAQAGSLTTMTCPVTQNIIPRQSFLGIVIGTKAQKTVKVRVERHNIHPIVMKNVVSHKNFLVHDPNEECVVGDQVRCVSVFFN